MTLLLGWKGMPQTLTFQLNGQPRSLETTTHQLADVITALELKSDRVAVELNGEIVRRSAWGETAVSNGDRLEVVHFVGGGTAGLAFSGELLQ
jgi:sulfur carrier protein